MVWTYNTGGYNHISVTRVNNTGVKVWPGIYGVQITAGSVNNANPTIVSDGAGGAIVAWQNGPSAVDVKAQRIDPDGNTLWTANGITVAAAANNQNNVNGVSDGAGGFMMMPTNTVADDSNQDGYGVYVGFQTPAPMGKFGLEYNYGSEYWTPFTQAQDDMLGSKLAVRGSVAEGYYIWDINPNMFIKLAGLFYDYEYTGSGSPVGKPQKVDDVLNGTAFSMMPVADTAWDANLGLTIKF